MTRQSNIFVLVCSLGTFMSPLFAAEPVVKITEEKDKLQITIDGKPFTTYNFTPTPDDPEWRMPYFFPVYSTEGVPLTADRARETINENPREHPHHRSVWIGMGDINGVDHWTFKQWHQRHVKFTKIEGNMFVQELAWDGKEPGKPVLTEVRTVRIVAHEDGSRGFDITTTITAASGDAVFRVKPLNVSGVEGGWLAVRVPMEASTNPASLITTSAGTTGERAARSTPSNWCDYSGMVQGKMRGVTLYPHPTNPGYPSPFAVRQWGMMTIIGVHDWTLPAGKSQSLRHMLLFHDGPADPAKFDRQFKEYSEKK